MHAMYQPSPLGGETEPDAPPYSTLKMYCLQLLLCSVFEVEKSGEMGPHSRGAPSVPPSVTAAYGGYEEVIPHIRVGAQG